MERKYPFIVLEGVDYSGKSTIIKELDSNENMLILDGIPQWNKDKARGKALYSTNQERFEYFRKLNHQFSEEIRKKTLQEKPIFLARYALGTIGNHNILLSQRTENDFGAITTPDITFLLEVEEERIQNRMLERPPQHKYENNSSHLIKVQNEMKRIAKDPQHQAIYGRTIMIESKEELLKEKMTEIKNEIHKVLLSYQK